MELTVMDRLVLLHLLPETGSFLIIKEIRETREQLSFDGDEVKELSITEEDGKFEWDGEAAMKAKLKVVEISPQIMQKVLDNVARADRQEQLPIEWLGLLEKIGYEGVG